MPSGSLTLHGILESKEEYLHAFFEDARWPAGPQCLRCRSKDIFRFPNRSLKNRSLALFKCRPCGYQFSVTTRTFLHRSHLPLRYWWQAITITLVAGEKSSPIKVARRLGITYKSAWLMCDRIQRGRKGKFLHALLRNYQQNQLNGNS